jgi:transposase
MRYRELISAIRVSNLLAINETASSPDQILEKYGYAIEGQRNVRTQFKIGSRRYSAIAAYSTRGFRHWKVVEGSVNQEVYQEFLAELRDLVKDDETCIIDNCAIHKTLESLLLIRDVFRGKYIFLPKYSPHWNPIELAFSQIKRYLRGREHIILRAGGNHVEEINNAFFIYSEHGYMSDTAAGIWSKYVRNYNFFNEQLLV